jgi:hypothetical protein
MAACMLMQLLKMLHLFISFIYKKVLKELIYFYMLNHEAFVLIVGFVDVVALYILSSNYVKPCIMQ